MLTKELIAQKCNDLQKEFVNFELEFFSEWQGWVVASERMANGETVSKEEIPKAFITEYEWAKMVLETEAGGEFNWNDPKISEFFAQTVQTPFYKLWGEVITEISLRLADLTNAKTLVEAGAGKGNVTAVMLDKMASQKRNEKLFITDSQPVILETADTRNKDYPQLNQETLIWNVAEPPQNEFVKKIAFPSVLYERAMLTYTKAEAIENLSHVADILVMGDYFNYTGELFAYDRIFERIGAKPLYYKDVKRVLDRFFPNQYLFDVEAAETLKMPNLSLIIAWK